jgi:hypothetical protein
MPANAKLLAGGKGSKALKRPFAESETIFVETMEDLRSTLAAIATDVDKQRLEADYIAATICR